MQNFSSIGSEKAVVPDPYAHASTHARKSPDGHLVFGKLKIFSENLTDFHQILTRCREKNTLQYGIRNSEKELFLIEFRSTPNSVEN